jgi:glycosyltransferase involved in cell wall biosynthesis
VVAWASGGAKEVIAHEQTGLLVEPHATPALAEAIVRLLRDPALCRQFGVAGRRRVEEIFSPSRMCEAVVDAYDATLGLRRSPAPGASADAALLARRT